MSDLEGNGLPRPGQRTEASSPAVRRHRAAEVPVSTGSSNAANEGAADLRRYWQIVRTHWATILGTCAIVASAVAVGTFLQSPVYRAAGMMEIRRQGAEVGSVDALFQADRLSSQYLQTQHEILRSPGLARRVIADLGLIEALPPEVRAAEDPAVLLERMVANFRSQLFVEPLQGSYLVRVQFESDDPDLAARAVNSIFENYIRLRVEAGHGAVQRLEQQVATARLNLMEAERRLSEYVRSNQLLVVANVAGERENIPHERLRQLQQELTAAEAARYEKESRYNLVRAQGVDALSSEVLRSLSVRVAELRGEYARLRSTFTDAFPRTNQVKQQLEELEAQLASERERIGREIRDEYFAAVERQQLLGAAFREQQGQIEGLTATAADYYVLQRNVEAQRQLFATLQQRQKEAEISAALATAEVDVLERASPPLRPVRPNPKRNVQLAILAGLMLGLGLAVVRELTGSMNLILDEVSAQSVPILGMIPSIPTLEDQGRPLLSAIPGTRLLGRGVSSGWPRIDESAGAPSLLAEAFGTLRTSVLFDPVIPPPRCLAVTSTQPGEGKTTVSANLALSLTRLSRRVLLIDADLRRPALHRAFGVEPLPGLAEGLAGGLDWSALVRTDVAPGLDLIPAGRPPRSPSELLSSEGMLRLVEQATALYDVVILDSPALMINAADTRLLAPLADGTIVVIRGGTTSREHVRQTLRQVPNLIGVVLNDLDVRRHFPAWYQSYETEADSDSLRFADA